MPYDSLLREAEHLGLNVFEKPMPYTTKGLYADNVIWINKYLPASADKTCILAEELGHYHTSSGNILDQSKIENVIQEKRARFWAYSRLIPFSKIVQAYKAGVSNHYELAEFIGVTEEFLRATLDRYKEKYGLYTTFEDYTIHFEPLKVIQNY